MKKKILIGSIFAVLLMLSMPVISNIQAQPSTLAGKSNDCDICPQTTTKPMGDCRLCYRLKDQAIDQLNLANDALDRGELLKVWLVHFPLYLSFIVPYFALLCERRCPDPE